MRQSPCMQKSVASIVVVAFSLICVFVAPAQAAMVGTADILQHQDSQLARQKVLRFMERQDVMQQLQAWGVDADEAKARVHTMTDDEIAMLANKIDQVPAGGDTLGVILVVSVIAFIVLIILDIMGVTDIFTFIKKR